MLRLYALSRRAPAVSCRGIHVSTSRSAAPAPEPITPDRNNPARWTPTSIRTGLIARKRGMTAMWDDHGARYPVTVLQLENCQVTANVVTVRKDKSEYHAVQVAASDKTAKNTTKQMRGHFRKAGVMNKAIVREFPVTPDAHIPVGTTLSAVHFVPGQYVDVIANSLGKGFQGVMKRWNFKGLRASHGVSASHRSGGSMGGHQDPGRIWPGKKMAGRQGGKRITAQNLHVVRVDTALDLVFIRGCIPGIDDAQVLVKDAKKRMICLGRAAQAKGQFEKVLPKGLSDLPFPAGTKELAKKFPPVIVAPTLNRNPFIPQE